MTTLPIYKVDAFAPQLFMGNPAAVVPLEKWLPDKLLQLIASENNLSETAFFVKEENGYRIRWFTPVAEVDLCGHATLASAFVLFNELGFQDNIIEFESRSGILKVSKDEGGFLILDFPADNLISIDTPQIIIDSLAIKPFETLKGKTDYLVVIESESDLEKINPDFNLLKQLDGRGVIVSARGSKCDIVSRCFYPNVGIDEDPATGSAQTTLVTYWSQHFDKENLTSTQLSKRKGFFICRKNKDRIEIGGEAKLFLKGEIFIP